METKAETELKEIETLTRYEFNEAKCFPCFRITSEEKFQKMKANKIKILKGKIIRDQFERTPDKLYDKLKKLDVIDYKLDLLLRNAIFNGDINIMTKKQFNNNDNSLSDVLLDS